MSNAIDSTGEFLEALAPHLSPERRKGVESLQQILKMFPGQSPGDVEKGIRALLANSRTSVPAMIQRAKDLVQAAAPGATEKPADSIEAFLKDAAKCAPADLRAIAAGIQLPVPAQKKAILAEIRQWLESMGAYAPKSASEKRKDRARELVGDLPQRLGGLTPELAAEIVGRAEAASKDKQLGAEGFVEFASLLLGTPVKGTKPGLLKKIREFIDRLVVSNAQTGSF
jgi:hypothetical protein